MQSIANFNHLIFIAQYEIYTHPRKTGLYRTRPLFCLISNRTIRLRHGVVAAKVTALFDDQIAPVVSFILTWNPLSIYWNLSEKKR